MAKERARHTKANTWDEAYKLKVIRDGERIDPGANFFVLMLDQLGLQTRFSCDGHSGHFYVMFMAPYEQALAIKAVGYFSVEIEGEEYWSIRSSMIEHGQNRAEVLRGAASMWERYFGELDFSRARLS